MENICFPLAVDILWFNYLPDLSLRTLHRIYHRRTGRESWMNYAQGDIISLLAAVFISHSALAGLPLARCKINIRYQFVRPVHVTNNANWFTVCVPHKTPSKSPAGLAGVYFRLKCRCISGCATSIGRTFTGHSPCRAVIYRKDRTAEIQFMRANKSSSWQKHSYKSKRAKWTGNIFSKMIS